MKHVRSSLRGAARLAPLPAKASLIGLWSGRLAFASGPNLRHLVLACQGGRWIKPAIRGLRRIEALLDPPHGGAPGFTFGNLLGDEPFECREAGRRPVAFTNLICFRKFDP